MDATMLELLEKFQISGIESDLYNSYLEFLGFFSASALKFLCLAEWVPFSVLWVGVFAFGGNFSSTNLFFIPNRPLLLGEFWILGEAYRPGFVGRAEERIFKSQKWKLHGRYILGDLYLS
jgi:hypothetical protein